MKEDEYPRIRDLPAHEREPFRQWIYHCTRPWIMGVPRQEQDWYYECDYRAWASGLPVPIDDCDLLLTAPEVGSAPPIGSVDWNGGGDRPFSGRRFLSDQGVSAVGFGNEISSAFQKLEIFARHRAGDAHCFGQLALGRHYAAVCAVQPLYVLQGGSLLIRKVLGGHH